MKHRIIYLSMLVPLFAFLSCGEKLETYDSPTNRLNFNLGTNRADSITRYTFLFEPDDFVKDTVWVEVNTMGFLYNKERPFSIKQVLVDDMPNATADLFHSLEDQEFRGKWMKVPANQNSTKIPVVVYRHSSLRDNAYMLRLEIQENENFGNGYPTLQVKRITISDKPEQPSLWNAMATHYFLGPYGPVKHLFLVDFLRDMGLRADNSFIEMVLPINPPDMGETNYWANLLTGKLLEENQRRLDAGLELLHEGIEYSEATAVFFRANGQNLPHDPRKI